MSQKKHSYKPEESKVIIPEETIEESVTVEDSIEEQAFVDEQEAVIIPEETIEESEVTADKILDEAIDLYLAEQQEQATVEEEKTEHPVDEKKTVKFFDGAVNTVLLNVRDTPSKEDSQVILILKDKTPVKVEKLDDPEWYRICTATGVKGYVLSSFINVEF